jgi:transcription initiation factor TFIID subunit 5
LILIPGRSYTFTGEDLAVKLWDLGSGNCIKTMTGHTGLVHSLAFSAESSVLVTGGADWTVRCWDVKGAGGRSLSSAINNKTGATER